MSDTATARGRDRLVLPALMALQVLSRLPFVPLGHGGDDDAWRVARTAASFLHDGVYTPSRFPGYPLHEALTALLLPLGGWIATNLATVAAGAAGLWIFDRILRRVEAPRRTLWLVLYAFFPLFWVNGANTMDYTWGLGLGLAGYLALLRGRAGLAGALLGLGIGVRPAEIVLLAPFVLHALAGRRPDRAARALAATLAVALAVFALPLRDHGPALFHVSRPLHHEWLHVPYYLIYSLGLIPALVLAAWFVRRGGAVLACLRARDPVTVSCVAAIASVAALFAWCPQDRAYLLPLYPFLFVLMARAGGRRLATVFVIAALGAGFGRMELKDSAVVDRVRIRPHLQAGPVPASFARRTEQMRLRERLAPWLREVFPGEDRGALVCGFVLGLQQLAANPAFERVVLPEIESDVYTLDDGRILVLADTLDADGHARLRRDGRRILFLTGALRYAWSAYGYVIEPDSVEVVTAGEILGPGRLDTE